MGFSCLAGLKTIETTREKSIFLRLSSITYYVHSDVKIINALLMNCVFSLICFVVCEAVLDIK